MEAFVAQITLFSGNFAPRGWMLCQGQLLGIAQYTAVFSLLGTTFGGDGQTTFALPDLRGRVPIGAGNGPGLSPRYIGDLGGSESVTLLPAQMPMHTHIAVATPGTGTASATLNGSDAGGNTSPGDSFIGSDRTLPMYAPAGSATVAMNTASITDVVAPLPNVSLGAAGGSQPFPVLQPLLGMNYIICLEGIFPSRN